MYNIGMNERKQKSDKSTVFKIVAASLSVLLVLLISALIINLVRLSAANERKQSLAEQSAKLDALIESTEDMTEFCGSDEFVEQYAREFLDMIYRGETVIGVK